MKKAASTILKVFLSLYAIWWGISAVGFVGTFIYATQGGLSDLGWWPFVFMVTTLSPLPFCLIAGVIMAAIAPWTLNGKK